MTITPDTKDWTWVLRRPCPDCEFDATRQGLGELPGLIRSTAATWTDVLTRSDAADRPRPDTWSPLEYACHVRDVHAVFGERVRLMLAEDEPRFANWDQDAAAVEGDYVHQDATAVSEQLVQAAGEVADVYAGVGEDALARRGLRSNGDEFTVATIGAYHLHDVVHHLHDVGAR